jgi:hypothetical protein
VSAPTDLSYNNYALIVQKGTGEDIPILAKVAKVLEEYVDVIPNELPNGILTKEEYSTSH